MKDEVCKLVRLLCDIIEDIRDVLGMEDEDTDVDTETDGEDLTDDNDGPANGHSRGQGTAGGKTQ